MKTISVTRTEVAVESRDENVRANANCQLATSNRTKRNSLTRSLGRTVASTRTSRSKSNRTSVMVSVFNGRNATRFHTSQQHACWSMNDIAPRALSQTSAGRAAYSCTGYRGRRSRAYIIVCSGRAGTFPWRLHARYAADAAGRAGRRCRAPLQRVHLHVRPHALTISPSKIRCGSKIQVSN